MNDYEREHSAVVRRAGAECAVLLRSRGDFPLAAPCTVALAQPHSVSWVISFAFVGLEVFTSIAAFFLLFFLKVEKTIGKEQAEIKARHEEKENGGEQPAEQ